MYSITYSFLNKEIDITKTLVGSTQQFIEKNSNSLWDIEVLKNWILGTSTFAYCKQFVNILTEPENVFRQRTKSDPSIVTLRDLENQNEATTTYYEGTSSPSSPKKKVSRIPTIPTSPSSPQMQPLGTPTESTGSSKCISPLPPNTPLRHSSSLLPLSDYELKTKTLSPSRLQPIPITELSKSDVFDFSDDEMEQQEDTEATEDTEAREDTECTEGGVEDVTDECSNKRKRSDEMEEPVAQIHPKHEPVESPKDCDVVLLDELPEFVNETVSQSTESSDEWMIRSPNSDESNSKSMSEHCPQSTESSDEWMIRCPNPDERNSKSMSEHCNRRDSPWIKRKRVKILARRSSMDCADTKDFMATSSAPKSLSEADVAMLISAKTNSPVNASLMR